MKKIFTFIIVVVTMFISISVNAQLRTQTHEEVGGYKEVFSYHMSMGCIRFVPNVGYFLLGASTNQFEKSMASIYLGDDKESAILSLEDLQSIKKSKPKDTLYVEGMGGKKTSIYFDGMGQMIFDTDGVAGFSYQLGFLKFDKAISAIKNFEE